MSLSHYSAPFHKSVIRGEESNVELQRGKWQVIPERCWEWKKSLHLVTVLMEKMSAVKELQTLSEDMSGWLSGSKQGIAALVCVLVMCLYYWSLGTTDSQFTEKQAYYERIGLSQSIILVDIVVTIINFYRATAAYGRY